MIRRIAHRIWRRAVAPPSPVATAERRRVAFCGPMPPAPTGIAAYDAAILGGLQRIGFELPIDVMWPVGAKQVAELASYPLGVFQLGNNAEHHLAIYRAGWRAGGLVVLHDLALDDFVRALVATGDPLGAVAVREALEAAPRLAGLELDEPLRVPWSAAIARRARGIVVHSSFARAYLEAAGCRTPIFVVPHPPPEAPAAVASAGPRAAALRASIGARRGSQLVVAPGDVNAAKQLEVVMAAVARLDRSVRLAIVGRRIAGYDVGPAVRASGLGERISVHLDVSDGDFLAWLLAADVVVDLRHPHRGESSGSLARAMQAGRPTVVSATGSYLDEPDEAVVRIAAGPADPDELAAAIRGLLADDERRAQIGGAAAAASEARSASEAAARGYAEAIRATLSLVTAPGYRVAAAWAGSLAEVGVDEALVRDGAGTEYIRALASFTRSP
jgi:glycosyltransferase involved in cell wall biosynthesis